MMEDDDRQTSDSNNNWCTLVLDGKTYISKPLHTEIHILDTFDMDTKARITPTGHYNNATSIIYSGWTTVTQVLTTISATTVVLHKVSSACSSITWNLSATINLTTHPNFSFAPTCSWNFDGSFLVTAAYNNKCVLLNLWEAQSPQQLNNSIITKPTWEKRYDGESIKTLAFNNYFNNHFLVLCHNGDLSMWTVANKELKPVETSLIKDAQYAAWNPTVSTFVLIVNKSESVSVWKIGRGKLVRTAATISNNDDDTDVIARWVSPEPQPMSLDTSCRPVNFSAKDTHVFSFFAVKKQADITIYQFDSTNDHVSPCFLIPVSDGTSNMYLRGFLSRCSSENLVMLDLVLTESDRRISSYRVEKQYKGGAYVITNSSSIICSSTTTLSHDDDNIIIAAHPSLPLVASSVNSHTVSLYIRRSSSIYYSNPFDIIECSPDDCISELVWAAPNRSSNNNYLCSTSTSSLLVISFTSGKLQVLNIQRPKRDSTITTNNAFAWTSYDFRTNSVRVEYEVVINAHPTYGVGIVLDEKSRNNDDSNVVIVISKFKRLADNPLLKLPAEASSTLIAIGDEFIGLNGNNLENMKLPQVLDIYAAIRKQEGVPLVMRFRKAMAVQRRGLLPHNTDNVEVKKNSSRSIPVVSNVSRNLGDSGYYNVIGEWRWRNSESVYNLVAASLSMNSNTTTDDFILFGIQNDSIVAVKGSIGVDDNCHFTRLSIVVVGDDDESTLADDTITCLDVVAESTTVEKGQSSFFIFTGSSSKLCFFECTLENNVLTLSLQAACTTTNSGNIKSLKVEDVNRIAVTTKDHRILIYELESTLGSCITLQQEIVPVSRVVNNLVWTRTSDFTSCFIVNGNILYGGDLFKVHTASSNSVAGTYDGKIVSPLIQVLPCTRSALPDWHPKLLLTELFGTHNHLGEYYCKNSSSNTFGLSSSIEKVSNVLTNLARNLTERPSVNYSSEKFIIMDDDSPKNSRSNDFYKDFKSTSTNNNNNSLKPEDVVLITSAIDSLMSADDVIDPSLKPYYENVLVVFKDFTQEHFVLLKAILDFINKVQLQISTSDIIQGDGQAQWFYASYLLSNSIQSSIASSSILSALHSDSQNTLVQKVLCKNSWSNVKDLWPALWVTDTKVLSDTLERMAQRTFAATRDAMAVVLPYLVLKKQHSLSALASLSDKTLSDFLTNDFKNERWANAAMKNGYSLLRKQQYEAAIGFFLLPDPPALNQALRVCVTRLKDPSLALLIARIVEANRSTSSGVGPCTNSLIKKDLLPAFANDMFKTSAALWWLNEKQLAMKAVVLKPTKCCSFANYFINVASLPMLVKLFERKPESGISEIDVARALAFSAHIYKMEGMNDTAMLQMMKASKTIKSSTDKHTKKHYSLLSSSSSFGNESSSSFQSSIFDDFDFSTSTQEAAAATATERYEDSSQSHDDNDDHHHSYFNDLRLAIQQSAAALNDTETRRVCSSEFITKLLGRRVATEIVSQCTASVEQLTQRTTTTQRRRSSFDGRTDGIISSLCLPFCKTYELKLENVLSSALCTIIKSDPSLHIDAVAVLLNELSDMHQVLHTYITYSCLVQLRRPNGFTKTTLKQLIYVLNAEFNLPYCITSLIELTLKVGISTLVSASFSTNNNVVLLELLSSTAADINYYSLLQQVAIVFSSEDEEEERALHEMILKLSWMRVICNKQDENCFDIMSELGTASSSASLYPDVSEWKHWLVNPLERVRHSYLSIETCVLKRIQHQFENVLTSIYNCKDCYGIFSNAIVPPVSSTEGILWQMQHPETGIPLTTRRFRLDSRVQIKNCFTFESAWKWFHQNGIQSCADETRKLLRKFCRNCRLRLLIRRQHPHSINNHSDEVYMFVNPWEVDAPGNLKTYMHNGTCPSRIELGWNSLRNPGNSGTSDSLWQYVKGEGYVVSAIATCEYSKEEQEESEFKRELFTMVGRNHLLQSAKLSFRFIAVITVTLVDAQNLISCNLLSHSSEPYVFLSLGNTHERQSPSSWKVTTYRSRVGESSLNPTWNDSFEFRLALPIHCGKGRTLCSYISSDGPPDQLTCTVFSKCKLRAHPFMGKATFPLSNVTSVSSTEQVQRLRGVQSGSLRVNIKVRYEMLKSVSVDDSMVTNNGLEPKDVMFSSHLRMDMAQYQHHR